MRVSAKLFLLDPAGRLLLLSCTDPARPGVRWWELPGGGVEPGEDPLAATVREVREETGIAVDPRLVGPLQWTQVASYSFRGVQAVAGHEGRLARLDHEPVVGATALTDGEVGSVLGLAWWQPRDLVRSRERFFPRRVPWLLPQLLDGRRVDEPPDDWEQGWASA